MNERRVIIRVFLASPSDLPDERIAIKAVVDEVNELWANGQGYQFDLIGWEDTVSQVGRPQEIINKELERCELFIGMLWKHWGTRPADDGPFSSGFHEEFSLSLERRQSTGFPEMSLFFKKVDQALLDDPGAELQKVLDFKKKIIRERPLLFQEVSEKVDLEKRVRKVLSSYLSTKVQESTDGSESEKSRIPDEKPDQADNHRSAAAEGEASAFLNRLMEAASSPLGFGDLSATETARFRLLASSVGSGANDEISVGVHDANLLYLARQHTELASIEQHALFSAGLRYYKSETVPLWHWFRKLSSGPASMVWAATFSSAQDVQLGALAAMYLVGLPIFVNENFERSFFIEKWLESKSSAVKVAALKYLGAHGLPDDIPLVERELDGSDFSTKTPSIEALIGIKLRSAPVEAARIAVQNSFETIDSSLLSQLKPHLSSLDKNEILVGVDHSNSIIRTTCIKLLLNDSGSEDFIASLLSDERPSVQIEGYGALLRSGRITPLDEVRKRMVKPRGGVTGAISIFGSPSNIGEREFESYRDQFYAHLSRQELEAVIAERNLNESSALKTLYSKHFGDVGDELRRNLGDRFVGWFNGLIEFYEQRFGAPAADLIERTRKLEKHLRTELIRHGLEVLCLKGNAHDQKLIGELADEGYFPPINELVGFIAKYGTLGDVQTVVKAVQSGTGTGLFGFEADIEKWSIAASALVKLARGQLGQLLSAEMPSQLKTEIIRACGTAEFRRLAKVVVDALLRSESDNLRRAAVIKILSTNSKARIRALLADYSGAQTYYYNVVHWLDFGCSMTLETVRESLPRIRP